MNSKQESQQQQRLEHGLNVLMFLVGNCLSSLFSSPVLSRKQIQRIMVSIIRYN